MRLLGSRHDGDVQGNVGVENRLVVAFAISLTTLLTASVPGRFNGNCKIITEN